MNAALVSTGRPVSEGGGNTSTELIFEGLRNQGINVDVFVTTGETSSVKQLGENVYELPGPDCYRVPDRIAQNLSVFNNLPELSEYDIAHVYGPARAPGVVLRAQLADEPPYVIVTANNLNWVCTNWTRYLKRGCPEYGFRETVGYSLAEGHKLMLPLKVTLELTGKSITKRADKVTVQTTGMKRILSDCGYNENKIDVVPNLLDDRFELSNKSKGENTLLFAGRLIERKGVLDILEAFIDIESNLQETWDFKILGRGELEPKIASRIEDRDNICLDSCPYVKLPEVYKKASVLVHGSKYPEPFSRTWLEAMASETAIVASRNPSSEAVLSDCAELYNPFDKESLRESLRSVLGNKEKRERLRKKGKIEIRNYRAENIINKYVGIYDNLVERGV